MVSPKKLMPLCLLLSALSANVQAACSQADLAGVWRTFVVSGSAGLQGFSNGALVFLPNGQVNTQTSWVFNSDGSTTLFVAGRAQLVKSCKLTGRFLTNDGRLITIVDAQLDPNKTVIAGVYRDSSGATGLANLVKRELSARN